MKTRTLAIALALTLAACGQPNDTRAQDGVFADNRVVPGDAAGMKASFAPVVRQAAPAVVNISARGVQQVRDPFWGIPGQRQTGSVGSGVIVRPEGVVVTNNHVIRGMQQIRVTL
ncbi:MAG: serine protease, partial [Brevundimonas sp.]|nr:serine protease [Brevundimonas sp.]